MGSFSEQDLSTPSTPIVFFICPGTSFLVAFYGIVVLSRPGFRKGVIMNKYTRLTIDDRIMIQAELAKKIPEPDRNQTWKTQVHHIKGDTFPPCP